MSARRCILAALAFAAVLAALPAPPAKAGGEPYLGWDFGGGFGIGLGTPPSAYDPCPSYGWPVYPYACRYRYRAVSRYRNYARHHHYHHYYQ